MLRSLHEGEPSDRGVSLTSQAGYGYKECQRAWVSDRRGDC